MQYTPRGAAGRKGADGKKTGSESQDPEGFLYDSLEPIIAGLKMSLIELSVFFLKAKGSIPAAVQVRAVVMAGEITGLEDCSKAHRAILPRISLAFPGQEIHLEVSSPGIDRIIKDAGEFVHYIGRGIRCYRTDISDWTGGVLLKADEEKLVLKKEEEEITLNYEIIAKARLYAITP